MSRLGVIFAAFASALMLLPIAGCMLNLSSDPDPFYVGVTYCGESVEEAKLLIDRVKNYTNLFVLVSGPLQEFPGKINEICDYAVSSDMYFIVFFGVDRWLWLSDWLETCEDRWGDRFLGVYYGDELGGKMIDNEAKLWDNATGKSFHKYHDGRIQGGIIENATVEYWFDGRIQLTISEAWSPDNSTGAPSTSFGGSKKTKIDYYPNGTVVAQVSDGFPGGYTIVEDYNPTYTYNELLDMWPFKSYDEIAEGFIEYQHRNLMKGPKKEANIPAFIADYALHWFDYKAGYDTVLAEFGWNHTLTQDIALARGAAKLQNKTWGAIITWKYNHPPYLDRGESIYNQMRTAYETGAEYVIIFNYAKDMEGPYGTLQNEHFVALERFWNEVVQSPEVEHGSVEAEAVLVLPRNYGWGMRTSEDKIWGVTGPDEISPQIWELSRSLLDEYGLGLDIVYADSEFPAEGKYDTIIYAPTGKTDSLLTTLITAAILIAVAVAIAATRFYFTKTRKQSLSRNTLQLLVNFS